MDRQSTLLAFAHALGRYSAYWQFASADLRFTVALRQTAAAWETFLRDAGPGEIGRAHAVAADRLLLTSTHDPRRSAMVRWIADHADEPSRLAAGTVVTMIAATDTFGRDCRPLLDAALDAVEAADDPHAPVARAMSLASDADDPVHRALRVMASAVDRLRTDVAFVEMSGADVRHDLPRGSLSFYVSAEPAGVWALNLALLARASRMGVPPTSGLISRQLFRLDQEPEELADALIEGAASALGTAAGSFEQTSREIARGDAALAHLSRNARAGAAWRLVVALTAVTRTQIGRALKLSPAGADIQARVLADAGLVDLAPGGIVRWRPARPEQARAARRYEPSLAGAVAEFDAVMADVDRLLACRDDQPNQSLATSSSDGLGKAGEWNEAAPLRPLGLAQTTRPTARYSSANPSAPMSSMRNSRSSSPMGKSWSP